MTKLKELAIWDNPVKDASWLNCLTSLEALYCQNIGLSDISVLVGCSKLKRLALDYNGITDISPLSSLTEIEELHLGSNLVSDITILETLNKIISVNVGQNQIKSINDSTAKHFNWLANSFNPNYLSSSPSKISLAGNPLQYPPTAVIPLGFDGVKQYYESSQASALDISPYRKVES